MSDVFTLCHNGETSQVPGAVWHLPPLWLFSVAKRYRTKSWKVCFMSSKGDNHLPQPAGHASVVAAQDTVGFLGSKHTLLTHVSSTPKSFSTGLLSMNFPPVCTHVWDCPNPGGLPWLLLVELHEIPVSLFFQPFEVFLDGNTILCCTYHSSQLCIAYITSKCWLTASLVVASCEVIHILKFLHDSTSQI